jgi:hypothetical protein
MRAGDHQETHATFAYWESRMFLRRRMGANARIIKESGR